MFRVIERLALGTVCVSDGAREALARGDEDVADLLDRHATGDWGDVDPEQAWANDVAVTAGMAVESLYATRLNYVLRVVTDADRSSTRVLRPEEC